MSDGSTYVTASYNDGRLIDMSVTLRPDAPLEEVAEVVRLLFAKGAHDVTPAGFDRATVDRGLAETRRMLAPTGLGGYDQYQ